MYIIDKNTDYYDFLSSPNMYGTDKKVVYNRRGSVEINDEVLLSLAYNPFKSLKLGYFILLEVGFKQHIVELYNIKVNNGLNSYRPTSCEFKLIYTFNNTLPTHHYPLSPISIREVKLNYIGGIKGRELKYKFDKEKSYSFSDIILRETDNIVNNPILKRTSLTSLFTPEEIWIDLQTYLSSLNNDEDRETDLTDEERAEKNGFNRKTSFRNPIK